MMVAGTSLMHQPGEGMPLFLLHGVGSDARSWAAALPAGCAIYAWDAPGYGESEPLPMPAPAPADYAARLLLVLEALALPRIALVGHSLGALFAAAFAARHPERVASLGLFSPALGYHVPPGTALPPGVQARIDDLVALGPVAFAERRAARLVFEPARHPAALAGLQRGMAAVRVHGYAQAVRALGAGDLLADAARITARTLVAIGAEDVVTPPENARVTHAALRNPGSLTILPGCGHAMAQKAPRETAALLAAVAREADHV